VLDKERATESTKAIEKEHARKKESEQQASESLNVRKQKRVREFVCVYVWHA